MYWLLLLLHFADLFILQGIFRAAHLAPVHTSDPAAPEPVMICTLKHVSHESHGPEHVQNNVQIADPQSQILTLAPALWYHRSLIKCREGKARRLCPRRFLAAGMKAAKAKTLLRRKVDLKNIGPNLLRHNFFGILGAAKPSF